MGMDSKIDFMRTVEKALSESVTVSDMGIIMKAISETLDSYEMRQISVWGGGRRP